MMRTGGCHCGAIRYEAHGEAMHHALCHCADCRRSAGAPMVGWAAFPVDAVNVVKGAPVTYASSADGRRQFCGACGTGLFYLNAVNLPGIIDIQTATLDDPAALPAQVHIQTAERLPWMEDAQALPAFDRYPPLG
ncbi:MAG: GFA family protein [Hyphomonadaceae bacterium]|nr:GFA family protein [Hyphomonadaceae bacterium]